MRTKDELMSMAVNAKVRLGKRRDKIIQLHTALAAYDCGVGADLKPDRVDTMRTELDKAAGKQAREGLIYATLRWALGGAEDINEADLDL